MSEETFSVYQFFPNDTWLKEAENVPPQHATRIAHGLIQSIGARIGTTRRVIITDGGDSTVFEWTFEDGITFPPELAGKQ